MILYRCPRCGRYWEDAGPPLFHDRPPSERAEKICPECASKISREAETYISPAPFQGRLGTELRIRQEFTIKDKEHVKECIAQAIDRCDNMLANTMDTNLRDRIHEISQKLMVAYSFITSDNVKLYSRLRRTTLQLESLRKSLRDERINKVYEKYSLVLNLIDGPIKLGEEILDTEDNSINLIRRLLRENIAELYLVPKGWIIDRPLWFKEYYQVTKNDYRKLRYNLGKLEEYLREFPEAMKKSLNCLLAELKRATQQD